MATIIVNGASIAYRQMGTGDPVVLVHGLGANAAFWNPEILLPLAQRYRVTIMDLRGHGYSEMTSYGYTVDNLARDFAEMAEALRIEKAHLVGHSFGGAVIVEAAVQRPGLARSISLADTRLRTLQPVQRLRDWPDWQHAQRELRGYGVDLDPDEDEAGLKLLETMADPRWRAERQSGAQQPLFTPFRGWSLGSRSAERWLELLGTTRAREELKAPGKADEEAIRDLSAPILAVYGQRSRCLPTCHRLKELRPDAQVEIVPGAGHFHPLLKSSHLSVCLLRFLGDIDARRGRSEMETATEVLPH